MSGEGAALVRGPMVEAPLQFRLAPGGRRSGASSFILCAKCETPAFVRRSDRPSPTVTQMDCHCTNTACGHTWRADVVFVHSISPGNIDRPDLALPVCPRDQATHVVPPARAGPDDQQNFFDPAD